MPSVKERVDSLEKVLEEYIRNVGNSQMQTEKELREFKDEMSEFKDEMSNFKDEMRAFKEEMREDRKKAFKQWGEIANKMGTLAEDFVAPCVREIAQKYFGCRDEEDFMVRRFKRKAKDKDKRREFDIIAVYNTVVIIVEVKSTPRVSYIEDFIAVLKELYEYFPEYKGKRLIPVFASLYLPDEVIAYLTKNGIYAMAIKEDMMDLINFEGVTRKWEIR
jgi:DNA repair exonuclease SbcCD ATPase subunit